MISYNNSNFYVDIKKVSPSFAMKEPHMHIRNELFFMISGNCIVNMEDHIYRVESGTIILFPAGISHKTTYLSGNYHIRALLYFDDAELDWICKELSPSAYSKLTHHFVAKIPEKRIDFITDLLNKIGYEKHGVDNMSQAFERAYFYQLILFLLRCNLYQENVLQKMDVSNRQIQKIQEYIFQNYSTDMTLASTAKEFNMSESNLSKKFKAFTGYRFKAYLINVRTHAAADALLNTTKSITDISISCGFSDSNSFGDTFKRIYGISPSQYRKRC